MDTTNYISVMQALGGVGLFLLGMIVMTSGLTSLAGNSIRAALMRFTHNPMSGALTGSICTAIIQSSSATTVAAIGFVGAGLMSFPSALGIVFGANIGTTITGWFVAILGFKLNLDIIVLPIILVGSILRLFAPGRLAHIGYAMAGFGVIFVGIAMMQQGMQGLESLVSFEGFNTDSVLARLQLVALGILFTIITQSSSAGVAAALTALFAGIISFEQAAALVIGMDVGTTATAFVATIGASVDAKRTGYSHVIYNLFTATGALLLLTPYIWLWESIAPGALTTNAEIALVAFHSTFNILGVIAVLPLTHRFVHFIERVVPDSRYQYSSQLDKSLLDQPSLALNIVQKNIYYEAVALLNHVNAILSDGKTGEQADLPELQLAIDKVLSFVDDIHPSTDGHPDWDRLVALIHTLDHLQRLRERCDEEEDRAVTARESSELKVETEKIVIAISDTLKCLDHNNWQEAVKVSTHSYQRINKQRELLRAEVLKKVARDEIDPTTGTDTLEAIRWLTRVSKHISRIIHHYHQSIIATGQ